MDKKKLIYVALGGVVLYFLYNYFSGKKNQVAEVKDGGVIPEVVVPKNNVVKPNNNSSEIMIINEGLPIEPTSKPLKGKYKFNGPIGIRKSTNFNNVGIPLSFISYNFKIGDVIDVENFFYEYKRNLNKSLNQSGGWQTKVSIIKEHDITVPLSVLTKVSDDTPITQTISKSYFKYRNPLQK